jgi:hypothetical protein
MSDTRSLSDQRINMQLADWLREGPDEGSSLGLQRTLSAVHSVNQRPRAMFVSTWLPRSAGEVRWTRPRLGVVPVLIILTMLLLLAMAAVYIGSRPRLPHSLGPSADRFVAYESSGAIYVARVDGTGRRNISGDVPFARSPVFSPDGSKIAFVSRDDAKVPEGRLFVVSIDGTSPPIQVSHGVKVVGAEGPQISWSPDASAIAFAGQAITRAIFVAMADGSGVDQVTDDTMDRDLPSWSTFWEGERIAYRATDLDGQRVSLEFMRPDGSDVAQITLMPTADASLSAVDWSPANNVNAIQVSYTAGFGFGTPSQATLHSLETGTSSNSVVAPWTDGVGGLESYAPSYSPDGHWIAFITAADGVILAETNGNSGTIYDAFYEGELVHLGDVADCWIDWSPDGAALYGGTPDGCTGTVVMPIDDPESAFVTYTPMTGVTSWQP